MSVIFFLLVLQWAGSLAFSPSNAALIDPSGRPFSVTHALSLLSASATTTTTSDDAEANDIQVEMTRTLLKGDLKNIAVKTERGFRASQEDRALANKLIAELATLNPTKEPAKPYYNEGEGSSGYDDDDDDDDQPTLSGKWTLIYSDAPDIITLDQTTPTAQLGRIGQECFPPTIKNVIEWKRPDWAATLPFSGTDDSRILQKVVTKAKASPDKPLQLQLDLAGIELSSPQEENDEESSSSSSSSSLPEQIQSKGFPVALLSANPISLQGPLTTPFGQATILYLDEELRILRTGQNYVAVNVRAASAEDEWF